MNARNRLIISITLFSVTSAPSSPRHSRLRSSPIVRPSR
jgi:hypothetical protein